MQFVEKSIYDDAVASTFGDEVAGSSPVCCLLSFADWLSGNRVPDITRS